MLTISSATIILVLNLSTLLLQHFQGHASPPRPFWIRILLVLDPAIEFPLILAFHPATLARATTCSSKPALSFPEEARELLVQIFVLCAVELLTQHCIQRLITFPHPSELPLPEQAAGVGNYSPTQVAEDDDETANALVVEFIQQRAALLVATALIGAPSSLLTPYVGNGKLHSGALVGWMTLRQMVELNQSNIHVTMLIERGIYRVLGYHIGKFGLNGR